MKPKQKIEKGITAQKKTTTVTEKIAITNLSHNTPLTATKNIAYGEKKMTSIYADNYKFEKLKIIILITIMFAVSINTVLFLLSAIKVFCSEYLLFLATTELILGVSTLTVFLLLRDDMFE